jgi:hypothetical protein
LMMLGPCFGDLDVGQVFCSQTQISRVADYRISSLFLLMNISSHIKHFVFSVLLEIFHCEFCYTFKDNSSVSWHLFDL